MGSSAEVVQMRKNDKVPIPAGELEIGIFGPQAFPVLFSNERLETLEDAMGIFTHWGEDDQSGEPEAIDLAGHSALIIEMQAEDGAAPLPNPQRALRPERSRPAAHDGERLG